MDEFGCVSTQTRRGWHYANPVIRDCKCPKLCKFSFLDYPKICKFRFLDRLKICKIHTYNRPKLCIFLETVIPVEVKAGNADTPSLNRFLEKFHSIYAIKLIDGNLGTSENKLVIPHFMAMFL